MDMFIVWLIAIGICSLPFWIFVTITGHEKHLAIAVVVLAGLGAKIGRAHV